jgi:NAD-dependent deacetylase
MVCVAAEKSLAEAVIKKLHGKMQVPDYPIVILTGAGISAESGLSTFRAENGLWAQHRIEDVCTPEAFARNPQLVQRFYDARREQLHKVLPNAAHHALADFARRWRGDILLVTQNVDDLHDRAHATLSLKHFSLIHMHGELRKIRCLHCGDTMPWELPIAEAKPCISCHLAEWRPHIVWFGEMPFEMERIYTALEACELFLSIGTSGNVYPAAGFVQIAARAGARTVEINLEPSEGNSFFDEAVIGKATDVLPPFLEGLLSSK